MHNPKISIIIPCYNQQKYLEETLKSVLQQKFADWEALLIDDGSTDKTAEIAKEWANNDKRFRYFFTENKGVSNARNIGLENAQGEFIQFLDGDDLIAAENFSSKLPYLNDNNIIISEFNILTDDQILPGYNKLYLELFTFEKILFEWDLKFTIPIHTGLFASTLLQDFRFDVTLKCFEDWLMWLHTTKKTSRITFIDRDLVSYRKEDTQKTASSNLLEVIDQRTLVMPIIKKIYGEKTHDDLAYHLIKEKSIANIELKKEMTKIMSSRVISSYLNIKKLFYNKIRK